MKAAVVIVSCDAFEDCWNPILFSFERFWPDCPFPIFLINNFAKIETEKVSVINVGKDKGFASNLKFSLSYLNYEYIIYFQDDYFLTDTVNSNFIVEHLKYCIQNEVDYLKIHSNDYLTRDELRIGEEDYCMNPINVKYSVNTSVAIWKKSILELSCIDGYSGWKWEREILSILKNLNIKFNSKILHSSVMKLKGITTVSGGAVAKGKWTIAGMHFLETYGFKDVIINRKVEGKFITILAKKYNKNPRGFFRFPIAIILRILIKYDINI